MASECTCCLYGLVIGYWLFVWHFVCMVQWVGSECTCCLCGLVTGAGVGTLCAWHSWLVESVPVVYVG